MKTSSLVLSFFFTSLLACSAEPPAPPSSPPAPRMIQPGETTVAMGALKVSSTGVDDTQADGDCDNPDCTVVYDMCRVMAPFPSALAIVEYRDVEVVDIDLNDCSDHHGSGYLRMRLKTLGVVAGVEVPEELTVTTYGWGQDWPPLPGQTFWVSLYEIRGEWFASEDYTVTLGEDVVVEGVEGVASDHEPTVILDIPTSFEGLVEEAEAILADYEPCRSRSWPFWTSRQKIHDFLATPGPRCGGPDYPEDPAYPQVLPSLEEEPDNGK